MQIKAKVTATWYGTPPRCRKPRRMSEQREYTVNIREIQDAEEFPLAFIVHRDKEWDTDPERLEYRVATREDGSQALFCPVYYGKHDFVAVEDADALQCCIQRQIDENVEEEEILKSIVEAEKNHCIFGGLLWRQTPEPYYTLSNADYGDYVFVYIQTRDDYRGGGFRADELELAKKVALESQHRKQTDDEVLDGFNKEYIELGDVFYTQMPTYETARLQDLQKDVSDKLGRMWNTYYIPDDDDEFREAYSALEERLTVRIWRDPEYAKTGYCLLDRIFYRAMCRELAGWYNALQMFENS